jgi:hypothetical protein
MQSHIGLAGGHALDELSVTRQAKCCILQKQSSHLANAVATTAAATAVLSAMHGGTPSSSADQFVTTVSLQLLGSVYACAAGKSSNNSASQLQRASSDTRVGCMLVLTASEQKLQEQ